MEKVGQLKKESVGNLSVAVENRSFGFSMQIKCEMYFVSTGVLFRNFKPFVVYSGVFCSAQHML